MSQPLRLVLVLHNHQPIGNFDGVCEQAYQDSYLPFLEVFERYRLPIGLHTSGSLMEWIVRARPEYLDRVAGLVSAGRVEVLGGPFFEPILTMIPSRDRVGQIRRYSGFLEDRFGQRVRGMWMPERVWEQSLASDLADAGMEYTILDDFHFKNAGWTEDQLHGHYLTEDNGRLLTVFPGSERLRYTIPFREPDETIEHLRAVAAEHPGAVVLFGDDGEKFGTWPGTKEHVYDHGWLARFFEALEANSDWLRITTPSEALDAVPPLGKVYIPEGSYREMTEWAMPAARQNAFHDAQHALQDAGQWDGIAAFTRGGFWRNFKARYPETGDMYARMQMVSGRLAAILASESAPADGPDAELLDQATVELYRGQCNCSYWHGAFGGVYLPHLRHAVYNHLIAADNLLDRFEQRGMTDAEWVEGDTEDYNLDGRREVRLASNRLVALVSPATGGELYELDVRSICLNLGATLARREEAYHRKVLAGPSSGDGDVASIHDLVVFKQEGLDQHLQYDDRQRNSLVDHFYDLDVSLDAIARNEAREAGDFVGAPYAAKIRRKAGRVQVQLARDGHVDGTPVRLTKGVTLEAGGATLEVAYLIEGLPTDRPLHFATEFNLAGLPAGADDRYFYRDAADGGEPDRLGDLGSRLDVIDADNLHLVDGWLGVDVGLTIDQPTAIWTYPLATVSQSEGGFEMVHQSVVVQPHWVLQGDANGRWSATLRLTIDTSAAEERARESAGEMASV